MKRVQSVLDSQLASGIRPHAYLLWGNDEAKKEEALQRIIEPYIRGDYHIHPNFLEISLAEGEATISIDEMTRVRARALETPFVMDGGEAKNIIVIRNIDAVTYQGIPVLLKILEEPPSRTMFVATTSRYYAVLPTLRSRFSSFRFFSTPSAGTVSVHDIARAVDDMKKIAEKGGISDFVKGRVMAVEQRFRSHPDPASLHAFECILDAYRTLLSDPTANKRLLGEYVALLS